MLFRFALVAVLVGGCNAARTHSSGYGSSGGDAGPGDGGSDGGSDGGGPGSNCGGACPDGGDSGTITFGAPQTYAEAPGGYFMTAADLDADGVLDLVESADYNGGSVGEIHILHGSGTGAFTDVNTITVTSPDSTVVSDFNHDGIADIAGIGVDGHGALPDFYLQGQGSLQYAASTWDIGNRGFNISNSLVGGDFDEDGTLDLVGAYYIDGTVTGGDGFVIVKMPGFTVAQDQTESQPYNGTGKVAAGDFDGDGHQDVITANSFSNVVRLYRGNGSGTVTLASGTALAGTGIERLSAFDLDRDGRSDFIAILDNGTMAIAYGTPSGFTPAHLVQLSPYASWITAGDFDADGRLDVAIANTGPSGQSVDVWRNTPGGFTHAVTLDVAAGIVWSLTAGDFNGDGRADLAIPGDSVVTIYLAAP